MADVVITTLEAGIAEVFRYAYEANCELEGEELTEQDRETLEDLSPIEALENLKDLVEILLANKRELKKTDKAELVERCEQFEKLLQKLENDVRTHIRVDVIQVEQQLKLHAEATQAKLEDLQKQQSTQDCSEGKDTLLTRDTEADDSKKAMPLTSWYPKADIAKDSESSHHRIVSLERGVADYKGDEKTKKLLETAEKKHKAILFLEHECAALKFTFSQKCTELDRVRTDYERLLREMQLSRLRHSKENLGHKQPSDQFAKRASPVLTDRHTPLRANGECKANCSPYTGAVHCRVASSQIEKIESVRHKAHSRTASERSCKRASSRPKV